MKRRKTIKSPIGPLTLVEEGGALVQVVFDGDPVIAGREEDSPCSGKPNGSSLPTLQGICRCFPCLCAQRGRPFRKRSGARCNKFPMVKPVPMANWRLASGSLPPPGLWEVPTTATRLPLSSRATGWWRPTEDWAAMAAALIKSSGCWRWKKNKKGFSRLWEKLFSLYAVYFIVML